MKYIKKYNENIFNGVINSRVEDCLIQIGNSFEMECKDKEAAKQDLIAFVEKHFVERNKNAANDGTFQF
jgi:hypothetical protein